MTDNQAKHDAKFARLLTAVAGGLALVGVILMASTAALMKPVEPPALTSQSPSASLLRRRVWLMARINLCEEEAKTKVVGKNAVCQPDEQARLPEYKRQLESLQTQLQNPPQR